MFKIRVDFCVGIILLKAKIAAVLDHVLIKAAKLIIYVFLYFMTTKLVSAASNNHFAQILSLIKSF